AVARPPTLDQSARLQNPHILKSSHSRIAGVLEIAGVLVPVVIDADRMGRTLTRIAHELVERNRGVDELALVGIRTRGVPLARRLAHVIREINGHDVPTGVL